MGLIKVQNVMSNELAKRTIFSRPPEPPQEYLLNDPTNSIFIGITKLFSVPFTWTFAGLTNPHISVVGITGAGKSFFVKTFLIRASYIWNTNAIIIDWAGEYLTWVKQSGGTVGEFAGDRGGDAVRARWTANYGQIRPACDGRPSCRFS